MTVNRPFRGVRRNASSGNATDMTERVPRVARLMALAIRFDQLIREGVAADQAELARLGQVSRARLTQIMNLSNLAPEIQEQLLHLRLSNQDGDAVSERQLRPIAATPCWRAQRRAWGKRKTAR